MGWGTALSLPIQTAGLSVENHSRIPQVAPVSPPLIMRSLVGKAQLPIALRCLPTLVRACRQLTTLIVHDDGTLDQADAERLAAALGSRMRLLPRNQADEHVLPKLTRFSALRRFRASNPLALKLIDVGLMSKNTRIAFCDSDVLFFHTFVDLFPVGEDAAVFMKDYRNAYSMSWKDAIILNEFKILKKINTGLFCFPQAAFDLDYLNYMLSRPQMLSGWPGHAEQTAWAALAGKVATFQYDPSQVRVVDGRIKLDENIQIAHFVATHRERLSEIKLPQDLSSAPGMLGVVRPGRLSVSGFLTERLIARARRPLGIDK
jgi:hypothetical protein